MNKVLALEKKKKAILEIGRGFIDSLIPSEDKCLASQVISKLKRKQFKKISWTNMYQKRIDFDPQALKLIIWV